MPIYLISAIILEALFSSLVVLIKFVIRGLLLFIDQFYEYYIHIYDSIIKAILINIIFIFFSRIYYPHFKPGLIYIFLFIKEFPKQEYTNLFNI